MKIKFYFILAITLIFNQVNAQQIVEKTKQKKAYQANWESLRTHKVPKWAKDAKFGIYAHWGVYSVTGNWDYKIPNWGTIILLDIKAL